MIKKSKPALPQMLRTYKAVFVLSTIHYIHLFHLIFLIQKCTSKMNATITTIIVINSQKRINNITYLLNQKY